MQNKKNIIISIVIPFYDGNKYINRTLSSILKASSKLPKNVKCDIVIVNDSPWERIKIAESLFNEDSLKIITNEKNIGIHGARINGLAATLGDYVLFLDQDDVIVENYLYEAYKVIKSQHIDVIVGNAEIQKGSNWFKLYKKRYSFLLLNKMFFYINDGCQIVSPGQTIIRKESVPTLWLNLCLQENGADDYLLWMLMLLNKRKFYYMDKSIYKHNDTGKNVSTDIDKMKKSELAVAQILKENNCINDDVFYKIKKRIDFQNKMRKNKRNIVDYIKGIDIIITYIMVRILRLR